MRPATPSPDSAVPKSPGVRLAYRVGLLQGALALFCALGAALYLQAPSGLLAKSTPVASSEDFQWYDWASENDMIADQGRGGGSPDIVRLNVRTGERERLAELTRSLGVASCWTIDTLSQSKQQIHCFGAVGRVNSHEFFTLSGARRSYPDAKDEIGRFHGAWGPDSRTWTFVHGDGGYLEFGVLSVGSSPDRRDFRIRVGAELHAANIEGVLNNGHVLVSEGARRLNPVRCFQLFEYDLEKHCIVKTYRIELPFTADVGDSALSPSRDRIAFLLETADYPNALSRALGRLFGRSSGQVQSLFVAPLQSAGSPTFLGSEVLTEDVRGDKQTEISDLRWVPGEKRLSYVFRNAVWTAPTE